MFRQHRFMALLAVLVMLTPLLAACGGSSDNGNNSNSQSGQQQPGQGGAPTQGSEQGGSGMIDHLDFGGFGGGSNPQVNYNPYSPNALSATYTFEPLMVEDSYHCQLQPWLATKYEWKDPQTLVYTIRDGVKWNDGQPFSADDVVFTFNMLQKSPALDTQGVWQALDNVSSQGNQVTFKFKTAAVPMLERVSTGVLIVPKHIWEKEADPVKFTNDSAVGTGPFKPTSFNGLQLVLSRNDSYWQADKIHVKELRFHKNEGGNQVEQLKLAQGAYDTNAMFVPDIQQVYTSKDPQHFKYWFAPGGVIGLGMNLKKAPFNDVEFRKGVAYAINRDDIVKKAEFGYVTKASQTGLVLPAQKAWMPSDVPDDGVIPYDQNKALDILDKAGYKKVNGKITDKSGKPITITFLVQNGWTDWIQAAQIVQQDLNALGFTVNVQTPAPDQVEAQRAAGNYDMVFIVHGGSCAMYDNYYNHMDSKAPTTGNYIFWNDPKTDQLIDQLRQATNVDDQKKIVGQLASISYNQFPDVALWYGAVWFEYSTRKAVGWPNQDDPYAKSSDSLLIITHLKPAPDYKPGS